MKNNITFTLLTCALLIGHTASAQFPSVNVEFVNATQGERASSDIWINFLGGGAAILNASTGNVTYNAAISIGSANIWDGSNYTSTNIFTNTSYSLASIANGTVSISTFGGGRAYVSYGGAMTGLSNTYSPVMGPYPGWQPPPVMPDNFTTRFQAFELTIQPSVTVSSGNFSWSDTNQVYANLSYIDQVSISTGIKVLNPPIGATNPSQTSQNTQALINAVKIYQPNAASSTNSVAGTNIITNAGNGTQYIQVAGSGPGFTNNGSTSIANPSPIDASVSSWNIVRAAGPGQMPTEGTATGPTVVYHTWDNYIAALNAGGSLNSGGNLTTKLAGSYGASGQTALTYSANATFHTENITLGSTQYTGYVEISNFLWGGNAQSNIYVPYTALTASTGLYGTNPGYSIGGSALVAVPGNTLETRVVGDLVAGMNFGLVGSTVNATYGNSTQALGAFTSNDWWAIGIASPNLLFEGAQSNPDFYNTYAAALQDLTSGYAFGIQDRLGQNTTQFNLTSTDLLAPTLQFLIQPDIAAVPEASPISLLMLVGLATLLLKRSRKIQA